MKRSSTQPSSFPLAAIVAFCCSLAIAGLGSAQSKALAATSRPNVVLVQVDDMASSLLDAEYRVNGRLVPAMTNARRLIAGQGVSFGRYHVSDPICGPSRASLLTGRAAHNHGMLINAAPWGYPFWRESGIGRENLAVWLDRAGYRTIHVGKYTNGYGVGDEGEIPPGWDRWVAHTGGGASYYGDRWNVNGTVTGPVGSWQARDAADCAVAPIGVPGACTHATDVETAHAVAELAESRTDPAPFYLQLDYSAPHDDGRGPGGPTPPTRLAPVLHRTAPPSNLLDRPVFRGQPRFIRKQPDMDWPTRREIRERWGGEVASMKAVDEGVGSLLAELEADGRLANTYVIFTSDNGMFHGEHRIAYGKFLPHEPSTLVPFMVRGPGLPAGATSNVLGSNLDVAATVLDMTGAAAGARHDGRSLLPFAREPRKRATRPLLLQGFNGRNRDDPELFLDGLNEDRVNQAVVLNYTGFLAGRWKYVAYAYGEEELYDLGTDPGERRNLIRNPRTANVVRWARSVTARLESCAGASCREPVRVPRAKPPG